MPCVNRPLAKIRLQLAAQLTAARAAQLEGHAALTDFGKFAKAPYAQVRFLNSIIYYM